MEIFGKILESFVFLCLTPHVIYVPKFASILFGKSTNDVVFQTFNNVHVQYIFDRRAPQEKKQV